MIFYLYAKGAKVKKIFYILLIYILVGCSSGYDHIPKGYTVFKGDEPFTFIYPSEYNVLITDDDINLPIITITSEFDPTHYYVITCGENNLIDEHFDDVYNSINEEIEAVAGGGILSYDEFFNVSEEEVQIGENTGILKSFQSIVPDIYFVNSLYKFMSTSDADYSFVFFYSATSDHSNERDIILNSIKLK